MVSQSVYARTQMPERGNTVFAADSVGFTKMKNRDLNPGAPILEVGGFTYAFIFTDGIRTIVCPINDNVRKELIQRMRTVPLEVVTSEPVSL